MVLNSWSTPEIFTAVIAYPSKDDNKIRRNELPIVTPKPGSKGRNSKVPSKSVALFKTILSGFTKFKTAIFII